MKKLWIISSLLLLTGCSAGGIDAVSDVYEEVKIIEETMAKDVTVHTVIGEAPGVIVKQDERQKWVEVELAAVSQHPTSLVQSSNDKLYKAELVAFNEETEKAYLKIKSSLKVEQQLPDVDVELQQDITYEDRLRLKDKYGLQGEPSEKITEFDELLFTINPDEVEAFIWTFEQSSQKASFIANDLLLDTLQEASASDFTYKLDSVEAVAAGKTLITVVGAITITDAEGKETAGQITYSVTTIDNAYKIMNIQLSE